jgi:ABC-type transport system involved in multi-copper enzyme maturation permease subunit
MNNVLALAGVVIKELYRRKDFYVLFVMTALITMILGSVRFFDDDRIARYLKDACLLLVWISSLVIAITTAARQLPSERESRTILPLLAKPVGRGQLIAGKFLGVWLACGLALLVFYFFFGLITASREHAWPLAIYFQALWLHWICLAVVVAMALLGSVVFAAPSSNNTICFIAVIGILFCGGHLNGVAIRMGGFAGNVLFWIYYAIPHLEWYYDVRDFVVHDWGSVPALAMVVATFYGLLYSGFLLGVTWVLFRRKTLTV